MPDGPAPDPALAIMLAGAGGGPITAPDEVETITAEASLQGEVRVKPDPPIGENPGDP